MFGKYNKVTKMSNTDSLFFLGLAVLGGYTVFNSFYYGISVATQSMLVITLSNLIKYSD